MAKKKNEIELMKFRVILDTENDVFRDIEFLGENTFAQLHKAILSAFNFSEGEMASFYLSDENWEKGAEIPLMDMGEWQLSMETTRVTEFIANPGDRVLYVYDFMRMWIFYVELMEHKMGVLGGEGFNLALAFGDAPKQDEKEMEAMFDDLMVDDSIGSNGDDGDGEEDDDFGFGDDEHFDSNDFDGHYEER
jgi:hypothetical protein